jgi:hypothetical protein
MAFQILSGKGSNLPVKLIFTVHLRHENPQLGIWISLSFWIQFKFGFSHYLEDQLVYNFPIYRFWSLYTIFWVLYTQTGAHRTDRAENALGTTSRACDATCRLRAAAMLRPTLEARAWARFTSGLCARSETRPRPGSRAPAAHAHRGPSYPVLMRWMP